MDDDSVEKWQRADEEIRKNLPPGVKLVRTLRGHTDFIGRIAWSPDGKMLASPSADKTVRLWNVETGECLFELKGHKDQVKTVSFDKCARILASGGFDGKIKLWEAQSGRLLHTLVGHSYWVNSIAFDSQSNLLASGGEDRVINLWGVDSGELLGTIESYSYINSIAFDPLSHFLVSGDGYGVVKLWKVYNGKLLRIMEDGDLLNATRRHDGPIWSVTPNLNGYLIASAGEDRTIKLWKVANETIKLLRILEGHTASVRSVTFAFNGELLASKGSDSTVRLWNTQTGACVAVISELASGRNSPSLAFHPQLPLLATVGSDPGTLKKECDRLIHIWELDFPTIHNQFSTPAVSYTSAKVVLVGDQGVGKTGLGWRLAHGEFKEQSSTHGQQFWLLNQLCKQLENGTQCEAMLWDLAGQPDYRLIHALFFNDADLALILFDPTRNNDLLDGVEFWLKQLKVETQYSSGIPTVLIAARSDRGTPWITQEELNTFCKKRGIKAYFLTSAKSGEGINELIQKMQKLIPWDDKSATVTTKTFKRAKDFVLNLKEDSRRQDVILKPEELRQLLEKTDSTWKFSDAEMLSAVGHLQNHGYVTLLKTSQGEPRILLAPELLNNLAASFILEARRNQDGFGSLEEKRLLLSEYKFPELEKLTEAEKNILLDSVVVLFLEHNICFRETNPLNNRAYLVFPELINLKKPPTENDTPIEDGVAYTVVGAVENVYASMVVLMGYTQNFTRTKQWQNHARYEVGTGHICGFRLENEHAGELDFVLYFGVNTPASIKMLFQGLFENFLNRPNLTVQRIEPVNCVNGHTLNRTVVREYMSCGEEFAFCNRCGEKITLPKADKSIYLTKEQEEEVEANRQVADQRTRFEKVLFRLNSYVTDQGLVSPECFISYAWGDPDQELWVERDLATDLHKAGIKVVLDRWENARIGASVPRFVERAEKADRVIVVGTNLYRKKYENNEPMRSFVVAAEGDLIGKRMIGTEDEKESVLPVLLEGNEKSSFPPLLQSRVYADFRNREAYFNKALELLFSLYQIQPHHPVAMELKELLAGKRNEM